MNVFSSHQDASKSDGPILPSQDIVRPIVAMDVETDQVLGRMMAGEDIGGTIMPQNGDAGGKMATLLDV